jgi:hypothetical protein
MVSFSKLPGMVAFCIVFLTRTLGSAAPISQRDGGLAGITEPVLNGVANPLLTGVGSGVVNLIDGRLGGPVGEIVQGLGDTVTNVAQPLRAPCTSSPNELHRRQLTHPFK